jgi:hypothetical protein
MPKEKRRAPRRGVERLATIVPPDGEARYCMVAEMLEGGIRVRAYGCRVPNEFALCFSGDGPMRSYRVNWRLDLDAGAEEISTSSSVRDGHSQR